MAVAAAVFAGPVRAAVISLQYPAHERVYFHGERLLVAGRIADATEAFERAAALAPNVAEYRICLLDLYTAHARTLCAAREWSGPELFSRILEQARALRSLSPDDYTTCADYACTVLSAAHHGAAVDLDEAYRAWSECLRCLLRSPRPEDSISRQCVGVYCYLARIEIERSHFAAARDFAQDALKLMPESETAAKLLQKALANA